MSIAKDSMDLSSSDDSLNSKYSENSTVVVKGGYVENPLIPVKFSDEAPLSVGELKTQWLRKHLLSNRANYCKFQNIT